MTITLRPEHAELIARAMETGAYGSPDEVIAQALQMLRSENEWLRDHREEVAEKIERAFEQFDRGEYFSAEESRSDMEKRKAAWTKS